ncbi:UDP-N-acetylmuramyl-tripeptide synthetase [Striga asiatica]|uniref:UDP-N-acetylmuramyl-tripeptide synthetase n=1 Tax=Striga asiatica TaxID=4170 RepID=A0A5A7QVU3_STRAF|nr:UDP-N-acetylmuramyl-tripeptide synthetase [Striga asiatica]
MKKAPIFLLVPFLAILAMAAGQMTQPGFIYTRTRGRCTPQYWSQRTDAWPRMVPRKSTVSNVFGSRVSERYQEDLTMPDAAGDGGGGGGAFGELLRQSAAALLNSYARRGYPYASWEVKTLMIQALVSEEAAGAQARIFREANENCG